MKIVYISSGFLSFAVVHSLSFFMSFVLSLFLGASMRFRAAALALGFKLPISHLAGLYKLRVTRLILFPPVSLHSK